MPDDGGPLRFAVVCEAAGDQRTACLLADRVAQNALSWLEDHLLTSTRCWSGVQSGDAFLRWKTVHAAANRLGIVAHGHFSGEPGAPDARAARRALLVLRACDPPVVAAFLIRDSDNDLSRRTGLEQARAYCGWPFEVIVGVPHTKRECWLLAAFEPADGAEKTRLQSLRQELGFDPCEQPEKLTAKDDQAKRSAKRVWATLLQADEERGLAGASLETLKKRGKLNGLADYLQELETRYVPLLRRNT
jgi:hypothetical protein